MDPVSAFGLISGAFQVGQVIADTIAGLASLREKYQHADLTIGTLEQQLVTIRAAILQLEDWTRVRHRDSPAEYNRSLDVALDGCRTVMEALSDEVVALTQSTSSNDLGIGFRLRMRVIWKEDVMKGHQERLHSQIIALQLLVQACQCHSSIEQVELLRKAESRYIIWKVADDAATLRSSTRYAGSRAGTDSSLSHRQSTIGSTVFDFDRTLAASLPYQRVPERSYSRQSQTTDEGYASGVPTSTSVSRTDSLVLPGHPSETISPTFGHSNSVAMSPTARTPTLGHARRSKSDSTHLPQPDRSLGSKRERFQSVLRRLSQTSIKSGSSPQNSIRGLTDGSTSTRRRPYNRDVNTSIDLKSPDGASAPLIVKTAQTGSWSDIEKLIERGCDLEAKHLQSRRTALLVAAHCGNEGVVDLLIQKNARLDAVDKSGSTALHLAASRGHCGVLKLLLSEALNIEARDSKGRTALWVAAERAKVNARADAQMTSLHIAAKQGDEAIVKLLDATMMTALHYACENDHARIMEILLDNKLSVDVPGCDKRTPLICAAARKASVGCVDDVGMTALHWAAYNGHVEIVEILSGKKSWLAKVNSAKRTALHLAAMNSQFAVVELLLRKGISIEARCQSGLTALHYACLANSTEISKLLLMSGADIEAQIEGELCRRPAHIAAAQGSMGLLNLLCDKGASLEARDALGYRALGVACRAGHAAAVQNLLNRKTPVHMSSGTWARDDSPLCLAAISGHLPIVMLLLERNAFVLKQDEQDWYPYQYAAYHGHPRVLEILLARLQLEGIGFAPAADISEERKREVLALLYRARHQPGTLIRSTDFSQTSSWRPDAHQTAQVTGPLTTVPEVTTRVGPAQELPGTLEQGLPESRSQTPEQMRRPSTSEHGQSPPNRSLMNALEQNLRLEPRHDRQTSPAWEPQQSSISRAPLSHPTPIREGATQPGGFLFGNGDLFGGRFIDTPVSTTETSTTRTPEETPSRSEVRGSWGNNPSVSQRPTLLLDSDSESIASFSTASEGGRQGATRDFFELPA
ncbi:ankyrin repeat-containing domain protein [Aspergillus californicus]